MTEDHCKKHVQLIEDIKKKELDLLDKLQYVVKEMEALKAHKMEIIGLINKFDKEEEKSLEYAKLLEETSKQLGALMYK